MYGFGLTNLGLEFVARKANTSCGSTGSNTSTSVALNLEQEFGVCRQRAGSFRR